MTCTARRASDYGAAAIQHARNTDQQIRLTNQPDLADQHIAFASDFSGMDCQACTIKKLRPDLHSTQLWTSEREAHIRDFITIKYRSHNIFNNVTTRPLPQPGSIQLYTAGPPCQGLSSAGLRNNWQDPRSRLYMHSIFAIEATLPDIFLIESYNNLKHIEGGMIATTITERLRAGDYGLHRTDPDTG